MTEFVLVHGAWHGGWCWRQVADRLCAAGHRVFTPTLTGQGERHHLLGPGTDLHTHIADVLALLTCEELTDVILVGHSYGARPTIAATVHPAVRHWVSLDGVAVVPGQSLLHGLPEAALDAARATLADCLGAPPLPAAAIGVPPDHPLYPWVERRMTPMAWKAFETPLPLHPERFATLPRTYVQALGNTMAGVKDGLAQARAEGWPIVPIDSGHDLMVTAPDETVAALLALA
jgi:pimeloyl-ACP methyl ester carboxylesterase